MKIPKPSEIIAPHFRLWLFGSASIGLVMYLDSSRRHIPDAIAIGLIWFVTSNALAALWACIRVANLLFARSEIIAEQVRSAPKDLVPLWQNYRLSVDASPTDTLISRFNAPEWRDLSEMATCLRSGVKPSWQVWRNRGWSQDRWRRITSEMFRLGILVLGKEHNTRSGYRVSRFGWSVLATWRPAPPSSR